MTATRQAGIQPFCVTVDEKGNDYLPYLFGSGGYVVIRKPQELPRTPPPETPPTLDQMVRRVAGLGGFLNRKSDGFPGPQTLWIGLQRAADFVLAMDAQRGLGEGR